MASGKPLIRANRTDGSGSIIIFAGWPLLVAAHQAGNNASIPWILPPKEGGIEALEDGKPRPRRIWNKIPDKIRTAIVNLALEEPDLSPQ